MTYIFRRKQNSILHQDATAWAREFQVQLEEDDFNLSRTRLLLKRDPDVDFVIVGVWIWDFRITCAEKVLEAVNGRARPQVILLSDDVHYQRCVHEVPWCSQRMFEHRRAVESRIYNSSRVLSVVAITENDASLFRNEFNVRSVTVLPMVVNQFQSMLPLRDPKERGIESFL